MVGKQSGKFKGQKRKMGKKSRTKGHSFEREIAARLRVVFPEARRQLEYHARDARGIDIQETGRYRIQCKRGKKYAPITAIEEIEHDPLFDVPVLVTKGDRGEVMAALPFGELLRLIASAEKD